MRTHSFPRLTADAGIALATLTAVAAMAVMTAVSTGDAPDTRPVTTDRTHSITGPPLSPP
jgi:hypothetical protein